MYDDEQVEMILSYIIYESLWFVVCKYVFLQKGKTV